MRLLIPSLSLALIILIPSIALAQTAATPTASPVAGTYGSGGTTVTLSCTSPSPTICYTTDGSTPAGTSPSTCTAGTTYTTGFSVTQNTTVKAICMSSGLTNSAVGTFAYSIQAAPPTASPAAGSYSTAQTITLSCSSPSPTICYTTDGESPNGTPPATCNTGTAYTGTFTVSATATVRYVCMSANYAVSAPQSTSYTIAVPTSGLQYEVAPLHVSTYGTSKAFPALTTVDSNVLIQIPISLGESGNSVSGVSVSGGSLTWNQGPHHLNSNGQTDAELWWAWAASPLSAQTITVSWTGTNNLSASLIAVANARNPTGLTAGTDYGVATGTGSSGTSFTASITTVGSASWVFTAVSSGAAPTAATGNTIDYYGGSGQVDTFLTAQPMTAGTYTVGVTGSSSQWDLASMEIQSVTSGGTSLAGPTTGTATNSASLSPGVAVGTSGMGAVLANGILNNYLRNTSYAAPSVYVALFTGTPPTTDSAAQTAVSTAEVSTSGTAYARVQIVSNTSNWTSPSAGATANATQVNFANAPTASWGSVTWFALMDGSTAGAGNILFWGTLASSQTITTPQAAPYFPTGSLGFSIQ